MDFDSEFMNFMSTHHTQSLTTNHFFTTGTVGLTEAEAIELHGSDNVECYISSFAPLEWSITERHGDVSCYGKIVVLKHQNNKVRFMCSVCNVYC